MRIKGKLDLTPFTSGKVDIVLDNIEDLWCLYNLLAKGDYIKTATFRKIQHESGGKVQSTKKKLIVTIRIEEIDYDQDAGIIRIKGKNISENEHISIGQYQTCELGKGSFFSLFKPYWDDIHIDTLKAATDPSLTADVASIIMEEGVAHLYFITNNLTTLKGKVTQTIPKKRTGSSNHDKAKKEFFHKVLTQLVKDINFESVKCVVIASPGFTKDEFGDYMLNQIETTTKVYDHIKANLKKFIYVHSSSGYKQSLEEVLTKPDVKVLIKNTKYNDDNVVMERFNEVLGKEMDKAFFGLAAFDIASKKNAIDTLIITDKFLRTISPTTRKHVSNVIKALKGKGVRVHKMSSQHVAGEKVDAFGGIVGVLTYVVEEIAEIGAEGIGNEEEGGSKEEEESVQDEMLMEMINNNYSYNDEEEEKDGGKKKKGKDEKEKGKKKKEKGGTKKKGNNNVEEDDDGEDNDDDY